MLKQVSGGERGGAGAQPPSGGCVLKHYGVAGKYTGHNQPPSGGCVLKPSLVAHTVHQKNQPPSGGCVLKLYGLTALGGIIASRLQAAVC